MDFPHAAWIVLLVMTAASALAQAPTGEIRLQVTDPSHAGVQVTGRLENLASGTKSSFRTDERGAYVLKALPFGRYRLALSSPGFADQNLVLDIHSSVPISQNVTMKLGMAVTHDDVVATTPLAGVGLSVSEIPAPVQSANASDIAATGASNLSEFINRRLDSVYVNEIQGNPFQPDVNYRGYTASPLLGTPQGISVFMDGVRLNQPFGDVVSWDLIPKVAISELAVIPGSNPLFGLNTLGGALSIETKDGVRNGGTALQLSGGSFGRKEAEFEHGGSNTKGLSWYLASNLFFEDGWRAASPSNVRQFFGKLGWQRGLTSLGLTLSYANNALTGNGLQEQRLLAGNYSSVYTIPDETNNRAPLLSINGRHSFGSSFSIAGNAYYRYIRTATLNGDLNENSFDQSVYQPSAADIRALTAAGYTGFPTSGANASNTPFPKWRCIAQALQRDEPAEKCDALLNRTRSEQQNFGISGQLTWFKSQGAWRNQFTVGAAYDGNIVNFAQSSQLGYLNPDLSVTGVGAFGDGVTGGTVDGEPFDTRVDLHGLVNSGSVYATDTLTSGKWNLTLSGRYNHTAIDNHDRVKPVAGSGSLTATTGFGRFNPAVGATYNAAKWLNVYFGYSEGSRAPTSIELGCADPEQPCKLPNALAGDPPLKQVVTRTVEAGVRGGAESSLNWKVGWFWSENHDDILFVASTQTGFGYFKNFGQTRRQGVEVNLKGRIKRLTLGGGYTYLEATYRSAEIVDGSSNGTNDNAQSGTPGFDGTIAIQPGDRIPLIPHHTLKAFADFEVSRNFSMDLDFVAVSTSYARGNDNNLSRADGIYYLGPGTSPGYGVLDLGGHYQIHPKVQLFAQVNNLLNHRYYSGAQLGPTGFSEQHTFLARPLPSINGEFPLVHATFYAPGAPIGAWGGIRLRF